MQAPNTASKRIVEVVCGPRTDAPRSAPLAAPRATPPRWRGWPPGLDAGAWVSRSCFERYGPAYTRGPSGSTTSAR